MILATHTVVGTAVMSMMPGHPVLGFIAAIGSHYVIDAIPHNDYELQSPSIDPKVGAPMRYDRRLVRDIFMIGFDLCVGLFFSVLFLYATNSPLFILLGSIAGVCPDVLQFCYAHFPFKLISQLQTFHKFTHAHERGKKSFPYIIAIQTIPLGIMFFVAKHILDAVR